VLQRRRFCWDRFRAARFDGRRHSTLR
jgi:hypothetical protein